MTSKCKSGCNYFANDENGYCSSCLKIYIELRKELGECDDIDKLILSYLQSKFLMMKADERLLYQIKDMAQKSNYKYITQITMKFLSARSSSDIEAITNHPKVNSPLELWNLFEKDESNPIWISALEAQPLLNLYSDEPKIGWLYTHVIASHVVDRWNLKSTNILAYHGAGGIKNVPKTKIEIFGDLQHKEEYQIIPYTLASRWKSTKEQVMRFNQ